jgi:hypothetical protein
MEEGKEYVINYMLEFFHTKKGKGKKGIIEIAKTIISNKDKFVFYNQNMNFYLNLNTLDTKGKQ